MTRRQLLVGSASSVLLACGASPPASPSGTLGDASRSFQEIESNVGGRVGVYAFDTGSGRHLAYREEERFAMCSTFKWALAAAVLTEVDRARLSLVDQVPFRFNDLLDHSPSTQEHVAAGAMTVEALAAAAVTLSDNTAANLLLAKIGGPAGFTKFVRAQGDRITSLDRNELSLNENDPGDPRDTTSPKAMVSLMRKLLCGDGLSDASRERLLAWMRASTTGKDRIRAGIPRGWSAADKTGTGRRGAVNDVAILWPPSRPPILVAVYTSDSAADVPTLAGAHARIGKLIAEEL